MTEVKELIGRVVKESGIPEPEILVKMDERKKATHGLLSDYGAIYAVAKEFGIDLSSEGITFTKIKDASAQQPVNLAARVKDVFPSREFEKKDKTKGTVASMLLIDGTGEMRLVLWDSNAEITKKVNRGDILLVKNGFVKENQGVLEIHAGSLTNINVNPAHLDVELPPVEEKISDLGSVEKGAMSLNLLCRVTSYYPPTEFVRGDGSTGVRASFIGEDKSGKGRIVLWGENAKLELTNGQVVKIENAYAREGLGGGVEIHLSSRSRIVKSNKKLDLPELEKTADLKIGEIKPDASAFNVVCRIVRIYPPRDYSGGKLASLVVGDETGTMRVVLWNEKAELAEGVKEGDAIRITNAYSKANMNNEPEIHVGKYSNLVKDEKTKIPELEQIEKSLVTEKAISELGDNERYIQISGRIVDIDENKPLIYMTCPTCRKRVQNLGGEWFCESCGDIDPDANMVVSTIVEDATGTIRAVAFRDNAEKILETDLKSAMNLIGERQDESAPVREAKEKILNKEIKLIGKTRYNDFSDQLEFMVDDVVE